MSTGAKTPGRPRRVLRLRNAQRDCPINSAVLRKVVRAHLDRQLGLPGYDLSIHLLPARRMAEVNQTHLRHGGPTDVITFDYRDPAQEGLWGELLVCPAVAVEQAREFGTSWPSEIVRYIVHGILHLRGYDDQAPADRRLMKREEERLLRVLVQTHPLEALQRPSPRSKRPLESGRPAA